MSISIALKCSQCGQISKHSDVPDRLRSEHIQVFTCKSCGADAVLFECPKCEHQFGQLHDEGKRVFIVQCPQCHHTYDGSLD